MAIKKCALLGLLSALGALGRRFESCRPDSSKPSNISELPRLAFLWDKSVHSQNGQIMDNLILEQSY